MKTHPKTKSDNKTLKAFGFGVGRDILCYMKQTHKTKLYISLYCVVVVVALWALWTVYAPSKHPVEGSENKFDVHYALSLKPPFIYKYYLYEPYKFDQNKEYPLVVMLHGASRHMKGAYHASSYEVQKRYPMFVLVPVAPPLTVWASPHSVLPQSYSLAKSATSKIIRQYPIDEKRIYVTGYSLGGAGTFGMLYHYPDLFAAAIPLCGYWSEDMKDYRKMAETDAVIKIHHGTRDQYIDYQKSKEAYYSLRTLRANVEMISHNKMNHNIWDKVYKEMEFWEWLNAQSKP
ncbi:MAG: prolyl oligopeptidase family serine peptidase [Alphaproteobacteria bacterium]